MLASKRVACIIPARLQSTRFPRKMLTHLKSKPLLQWVWEAAKEISWFDQIAFAVDSQETAVLIEGFGGSYFMTSPDCQMGTERLVEIAQKGVVQADIWVNWQGDEPFINEQMIRDLLQSCAEEEGDVWSLCKKIQNKEEVLSPHIAKVARDAKGYALYFSRSPIPFYRDSCSDTDKVYYKHIGLYAFSRKALDKIATQPLCYLEDAEKLEQLRFLYHNLKVRIHETEQEPFGIDLPEHLAMAEDILATRFLHREIEVR